MNHGLLLPILLPMFAGSLLAMVPVHWLGYRRGIGVAATLLQLPLAAWLLAQASGGAIQVYALGNWPAPYGIALQLDRLAALMLVLSALLATAAVLYAARGDDRLGRNFHAMFQFQLMGLTGAFLAGDLFNLFVFFEILLIASYALMVHGGGRERVGAGLHYVLINLAGSSFFLVAIGILYGVTGTLNLADLGVRLARLDAGTLPLARAAGVLLMLVFGLKAAVFPLYFWLPRAYASTSGAVAALFAIMSKVGIYAILRFTALVFGAEAGLLAGFLRHGLWWLALATMVLGALGALASTRLSQLAAYLVMTSVGLLAAGVCLAGAAAWSATLYYLLSTTLCTAALFLLADCLEPGQGSAAAPAAVPAHGGHGGHGEHEPPPARHGSLPAVLFLLAAVAAVGLPPLSGFFGKFLLMRAVPLAQAAVLWPVLLLSSLLLIVAVSRTGTRLLWRLPREGGGHAEPDGARLACCAILVGAGVALVLFARPLTAYLDATAAQLLDRNGYVQAVLGREG